MADQQIGIIDIGSNSVRLAIYERTAAGAHRIIDGSKRHARLSQKVEADGSLGEAAVNGLIGIIRHFCLICSHYKIGNANIRAIATAAIRNAPNRQHVIAQLASATGLQVEILSGEEEASFGFLGMINSMDEQDGFLIDIGGGSTELSLFRNREIVHSVSFPFGCVNLNKRFADNGLLDNSSLKRLEAFIHGALATSPWAASAPGLPLIGLGGTARALAKIHQGITNYPFAYPHNYSVSAQEVDSLLESLRMMPVNRRTKIPGMAKDRADIVVPGLVVLQAVYRAIQATEYRVCGAGLRDGLFFSTRFPGQPRLDDVLGYSLRNLIALHPQAPLQHTAHVNKLALQLYHDLLPGQDERTGILFNAASQLFRIGATIDYYDYAKHTFYMIVNAPLDGLTHREMVLVAAIASYRSKGRARQLIGEYSSLLAEGDEALIAQLGSLLLLAISLDRSGTQAIAGIAASRDGDALLLHPEAATGETISAALEIEELREDFRKIWGLSPVLVQ